MAVRSHPLCLLLAAMTTMYTAAVSAQSLPFQENGIASSTVQGRFADDSSSVLLRIPDEPTPLIAAQQAAMVIDARAWGLKCDGTTNDGPALQAVHDRVDIGAALLVQLPSGTCRIASAVTFTKTLVLRGQGWAASQSPGFGTWFLIDGTGFNPFTLTGAAVRGAAFENLAVFQQHPPPPASGSWTPTAFPCVFTLENTAGEVAFRNVFLLAINRGVCSHLSGRLTLRGVSGQVFTSLAEVDKSYDADRYVDLHIWPYWSSTAPVMAYTQANTDTLRLSRVDTPLADRVFVFGVRSAAHFLRSADEGANTGGVTTKLLAGTIGCDFVARCLWVEAPGVTWQIGRLMAQGQAWASNPPTPLGNAAAVQVGSGVAGQTDGSVVGQIGQLWTEFTAGCPVCIVGHGASNLAIGVQYSNFGPSPAGASAVRLLNAGHIVSWASPPQFAGGTGITVKNAEASGTLTGPTVTKY